MLLLIEAVMPMAHLPTERAIGNRTEAPLRFRRLDDAMFGVHLSSSLGHLPNPEVSCNRNDYPSTWKRKIAQGSSHFGPSFLHMIKTGGSTVAQAIRSWRTHSLGYEGHVPVRDRLRQGPFLTVVRHPVDRLISLYCYYRDIGGNSWKSSRHAAFCQPGTGGATKTDCVPRLTLEAWLWRSISANRSSSNVCGGGRPGHHTPYLLEGPNCEVAFLTPTADGAEERAMSLLALSKPGRDVTATVNMMLSEYLVVGETARLQYFLEETYKALERLGDPFLHKSVTVRNASSDVAVINPSKRHAAGEMALLAPDTLMAKALRCGDCSRGSSSLYESVALRHWQDLMLYHWVARRVDSMQKCLLT